MKRVAIVTENGYLLGKIRLALAERSDVLISSLGECDICLWDSDTSGKAPASAIVMSRALPCELPMPFSYRELFSAIDGKVSALLSVDREARVCTLRGERIKLTELEAELLSLLVSAGGEFVSRERILSLIWGNDADMGIINVYIHYLREKLERGEKVILASRGKGYRIDEKYLGGKGNA